MLTLFMQKIGVPYERYGQILRTDNEWIITKEKMSLTKKCQVYALPSYSSKHCSF